MDESPNLPLALRRTRRSIKATTTTSSPTRRDAHGSLTANPEPSAVHTPGKRSRSKSKKRVRFSDPGPSLATTENECSSTGLTPMVRRTSLSANNTSRRHSTPARLLHASNGSGIPDLDSQGSPFSGEVRFLPLRQVLDGRVKRRIRRNGLSEELNSIIAERRQRSKETRAEIDRLKAELAEKDEEIARMHDETVVLDTDRVWELEQEVAALKRKLASRSGVQDVPSSPNFDWTRVARDPFSDDYSVMDMEHDDEDFGEATIAELACSTPTRRMRNSFPTPPATSPPPPEMSTPCKRVVASCLDTDIQASFSYPRKRELEQELESLQLEVGKLTATLESYSSLTTRMSDKLAPLSTHASSEDDPSSPHADLETHLTNVLQTLSDRTAALAEVNSSLKSLGFPGSDAFEVIESLRSSFRTARLELEYITPGEITLPLTAAGAAVLDLLVTQLRDLAKKHREADDSIDEYHSIEVSLRQQLTARVDAMDSLRAILTDKDARIADLELSLDRLKGAASRYTRDLSELEALVSKMDDQLTASSTALKQHQSTISTLESNLSAALSQSTALQSQLSTLSNTYAQTLAAHRSQLTLLAQSHGQHLSQRDARILALRSEVESVRDGLREACDAVLKLRVENGKLQGERDEAVERAERDRRRVEEVVRGVRGELMGLVRGLVGFEGALGMEGVRGEGEEEREREGGEEGGERDGDKDVGAVHEEKAVRSEKKGRESDELMSSADGPWSGRGKKRRRYDSGLGMLDEEVFEAET